jgi:hypothetical protein
LLSLARPGGEEAGLICGLFLLSVIFVLVDHEARRQ